MHRHRAGTAARLLLTFIVLPLAPLAFAQVLDMSGPFRVSGISVEGNKTTKERVILRELILHEEDTVPAKQLYIRLDRSRQNLMNLGLFNSVSVTPTFLGPHEVFLTVTVQERWFWWPTPIFKYSDPNFNTWWLTRDLRRVYYGAFIYRYNMRGLNETFYVKVQLGYAKEFALRYRFPFVDKKQRWGVSLGAGYTGQDEITIGTVENKRIFLKTPQLDVRREWKGDVQATLRPAYDQKHSVRLSYTEAQVRDTVAQYAPEYFGSAGKRSAFFSLNYTFSWDERDSRVFPLSGPYGELRIDRLGLGFEGVDRPDITTIHMSYQRSWRHGVRWSFGASAVGKTTIGAPTPYYVQEGLGYNDYTRGYEYYIADGQQYALGKANVLFALVPGREYHANGLGETFRTLYLAIYLNAFADFGYVWDDLGKRPNPLTNDLQQGYGLGLDVVTSYDQVMRIEYTVNALSERAFYLHFSQPF